MNDMRVYRDTSEYEAILDKVDVEYIDRLHKKLQELTNHILELKSQVELARQLANEEIGELLSMAPTGEDAHVALNVVYWSYEELGVKGVVQHIYGSTGYGRGKLERDGWVFPKPIFVNCGRCNNPVYVTVNTRKDWSDFQSAYNYHPEKFVCDDCYRLLVNQPDLPQKHTKRDSQTRKQEYAEYLKSDHWQSVRKSALERANNRCQICNRKDTALHVHHRTYKNKGNEQPEDLTVLCADCHNLFHRNGKVEK